MIFTIALLIGAGLLFTTLLSSILITNPFFSVIPFIGEQMAWFAESAVMLIPVSVFIIAFTLTRNIIMSMVLTIAVFIFFLIMGIVSL